MRVIVVAAIVALLTVLSGPAFAQKQPKNAPADPQAEVERARKKAAEKATDKGYTNAIGIISDKKYDPWQGVR